MTCRVRRAAILIALILVAACGRLDRSEAFTDPRLPPGLETRFWPPSGWAWGLLEVEGGPGPVRYGVAAPQGMSVADVIILPSHGESAEMWFETASQFIRWGYRVWILEGHGEGGSARSTLRRETAHLDSYDPDIRALMAFTRDVVRPDGDFAVLASGTAAYPALAAARRGYAPAMLILSGPFEPRTLPWRRPSADDEETPRRRSVSRWALANPDLRMGGVSAGWRRAHREVAKSFEKPAELAPGVEVFVITPKERRPFCYQRCAPSVLPTKESYAFANDRTRDQWLGLVFSALPWSHVGGVDLFNREREP